MPAKIKLYKVNVNEYRFDLIADNRAVIGSSEGYSCKSEAAVAIEMLKKNVVDDSKYEIFTGSNDKFYFKLKSEEGDTVPCSLGYSSLDAVAEGIGAAKRVTASAKLVEVG